MENKGIVKVIWHKKVICHDCVRLLPSAEKGLGAPFCLPLLTCSPSAAGAGSGAMRFKKERKKDVGIQRYGIGHSFQWETALLTHFQHHANNFYYMYNQGHCLNWAAYAKFQLSIYILHNTVFIKRVLPVHFLAQASPKQNKGFDVLRLLDIISKDWACLLQQMLLTQQNEDFFSYQYRGYFIILKTWVFIPKY